MLYDKAYTRKQIFELLRFIHWVLFLPVELEKSFESEVREYQEEKMRYLPEFLQDAMDDGVEIGRLRNAREMVISVLQLRFQAIPDELQKSIESIEALELLKQMLEQAVLAGSMEEFAQSVADALPQRV